MRNLSLLLPLLFSLCANAQEEQRWYQIEIAVFTQPANSQLAAGQETFRKDVTLAYKAGARYLQTPEEFYRERSAALNMLPDTSSTPDNALASNAEGTEPSPIDPELINELLAMQPFLLLPAEQRGLNDTVAALARRNRQEILFHEAWRQPVLPPEQAQAIVIEGGETFGQDTELSGQVSIGVSRYLHLDTNLWLTQFTENFGQGDQDWPSLPSKPARTGEPVASGEINLSASQHANSQNGDLWQQFDVIDNTYQQMLEKPFVINEIATLKQTRRMRSSEVHYIDHPRMGLLVLITPYDLPDPAQSKASPTGNE